MERDIIYDHTLTMVDEPVDHRRTEAAPREADETLRAVIQSSPLAIAIITPDGKISLWNAAAERIFGWSEQEALGQVLPYVPKDKMDESRELRQSVLHGGRFFNRETYRLKKDGSKVDVSISAAPLRNARGEISGILSIVADITEGKRAEEALRKSEEKYRELIENANDIIYGHDLSGNIISFNKAAERLTGYSREEGLTMNISDIVVPEHRELARQNLQRKLAGDPAPAYELEILTKDGRRVAIEVNTRLTYQDGKPVGVEGIGRDITARKQVHDALRMQAQVLQSMAEGVSVCDEDGLILYTNPAKDAMFGYEPGELIGKHVSALNIYPPEENARIVSEIIKELNTQGSWSSEFSNRKKDGTLFTTAARISALESSGKKYWLSVQQDITERKRAEKVQTATYKISEAANTAESLQALFRSIHEIVGELLPVPNLFIALYDEASETFSFPYFVDERSPWPAPRRLGRGLTEYTFRTGLPLNAPPPVREELVRRGEAQLVGAPSVDWFGVPLKTKDKAIGVLVVQSYTEGVTFGEDDKNVLVYVSAQIAMAIERKRAEDAVRESENRFRTLAETASDAIITIDDQGRMVFVNPAAERMFGYTIEEMTGANLTMLMPEHMRDLNRAGFNRYIQTNRKQISWQAAQMPGRHKNGQEIPLEISFGEFTKDDRRFLAGIVRDVAERKRAEQERARLLLLERIARHEAEDLNRLRAQMLEREQTARTEAEALHREWQTTFDAMTDVVMLIDREDRLIRANRAFYRKLGLAPEDCIGRLTQDLLHKDEKGLIDADKCPICMLRRKGERTALELPAGTVTDYPIFASIDPIVDASGNTTAVVQVVRDLSDLYRAREQTERVLMSLNATIEQMAEGLMVFDETCAVVRANRQAQRALGVTLEQMCADRHFLIPQGRFTDGEGRIIALGDLPVQTALREQRVVERQLWYTRPDERRSLLSITASPFFNEQNQLAGAIAIVRDVTERQREHERLQQADKLRALGQLASGVAHNFNNALAAVIGYTQLALPKVKEHDVERYLRVVEQSAKDAARMVERIQNFSRGSSPQDDFRPVRLSDIVHDAVDITRPRWLNDAQALGIKYDVRLGWQAQEDLIVSGEPSELREVFVNIILNALDAMPLGGVLNIAASVSGPSVNLTFADTGGGMTEEIKRRIFEPFFTTKGAAGLGMGLSESYRIIERHGGRIEVESRLRRGATFTIVLPQIEGAESAAHLQAVTIPVAAARVLVVDDEESVRDVLAEILEEQGHKVALAASAEEAQHLVELEDFDVVFTDLAMPKTDGVTAAAEIKSRKPATKVVLMSGYGADRAVDSNCIDAAISKPFKMDEIRQTMRALLQQ